MSKSDLNKIEEKQRFADNYNDLPPSDVVAFNELRSCADLLRLYDTGQLVIDPDFQREVVWKQPDQSRFIDSLTKQLPIPSMCISLDYKTEKRIVIDGTQRMTSIINFLSKDDFTLSDIEDIDERLAGKNVLQIKNESYELVERVRNVTIPITIIRCDYSKKDHSEYLFTIFKRLNSGGYKLNNQEIRNCIYNGDFNTLLKNIAKNPYVVKVLGKKSRFANEELILRFFAFSDKLSSYNGKFSKFLNDYMSDNRSLDEFELADKEELFLKTINLLLNKLPWVGEIKNFGKAVTEGLLYGISKNYSLISELSDEKFTEKVNTFFTLNEFSINALKEGLAAKDKVILRLTRAEEHFSL